MTVTTRMVRLAAVLVAFFGCSLACMMFVVFPLIGAMQ